MERRTTSKLQAINRTAPILKTKTSISQFNSPIKQIIMETKTIQRKILLCFLVMLFAYTVKAQTGINCSSAVNISLNTTGVGQHLNAKQTVHHGWYKFTATQTGEQIHANLNQNGDKWTITQMTIYSGTCSSLNNIGTASLTNVNDTALNVSVSGLTIGHTYYIELTRGTLNPCKTPACIPNDTAYVGIIMSGLPYIFVIDPNTGLPTENCHNQYSIGAPCITSVVAGCPVEMNAMFIESASCGYIVWYVNSGTGAVATYTANAGTQPPFLFSESAPGTYTVSFIYTNSCSGPTTTTPNYFENLIITVTPSPTITFTATPTNICVGTALTFTSNFLTNPLTTVYPNIYLDSVTFGDGNTVYVTTSQAANGNVTYVHTYTAAGTYTATQYVTLNNSGSIAECDAMQQVIINVQNPPNVSVTASPASFCSGHTSTLTASGASTYTWTPATGLSASTGSLIIANPTTTEVYTVTGTTSPNCPNSLATITLTVNPVPLVPIVSGHCTNNPILITNSNPSITYNWSPAVSCITANCSQAIPSNSGAYIVTASIGSCSTHTTINVFKSPTITVTPTSTTICSGNSANLTANTSFTGGTPVTWSPSSSINCTFPCHSAIATPIVTTNYTATATNPVTGCSASATATVSVNPTPTLTINDNPVPIICTQDSGTSVQLSATSSAGNYSWTPSLGLSSNSIANPIATPTATTIYTVTSIGTDGCIAKDTITVFVENCICNKNKFLGSSIPSQGSATSLNTLVEHSFNNNVTIGTTAGTTITFHDEVFYFAPNKQMIVKMGNTLILNHCHLLACTDMWQGIIVQAGAKLIVDDSSMIEDAFAGINCTNWLSSPTSNSLTVNGCVFNRNDTAIKLINYTYNSQFPATIENAVFTSRTLPTTVTSLTGGNYGWTTSATPQNLKATITPTNLLATPYKLASVPAYAPIQMKAPENANYSFYGIYLNNIGSNLSSYVPYNSITSTPILYKDLIIGSTAGATIANNNSHINLFDGLYYGVYAVSSNFTCVNNAFELLQYLSCKKCVYPNTGTAIYATNTYLAPNYNQYNRARILYPGYNSSVNPNTSSTYAFTPNFNNKFYDCVRAANILNYMETDIAGTDVRSTKTAPAILTPGAYGFVVSSPLYQYNYLRYNVITNVTNGIYFTAASLSSHQQLGAVNADYNSISADYAAIPVNQSVNTAIALDNSISALNCYSITPNNCGQYSNFQVTANENNLNYVYNGIEMSNWVGLNGVRIMADTNYIMLNLQSPPTLTQFGIGANHCYTHQINNNNINGLIASVSDTMIRGVLCNDDAISQVGCNSTTNLGKGFEFSGQNPSSFGNDNGTWRNNTMTNNGRGFELINNCILGNQGSPTTTNDNQWIGFGAGNYHTYNSGSNLFSSELYVRSTSPTYIPTFNGSSVPNAEYSATFSGTYFNTIIPVSAPTNSITACGTLPPPPPTNGSGRLIAERAVQDSIPYPILPAQNLYKSQLKYFKLITMNDSILYSSAVLNGFYTANQTANIGKLVAIESNLAQGNIATAQSMNTALAPTNTIESNYKMFYASAINAANNTLTVSDSVTLINLAQSCPAINGDVVYQARALYNAVNNQYQYFEDNCNYDSLIATSGARMKDAATGIASVTNKQTSLLIYPNPSTGDIFISGGNTNDTQWNIEVTDVTGRTVMQNNYTVTNGLVKLSTQLTNGVYFVKVTMTDGTVKQQKVIITK